MSSKNALHAVTKMEYPGRIIVIGKNPKGDDVVLYAITGRSPSSQARRLLVDEQIKTIIVQPTDEETLKKGDPDLLIYPCIIIDRGIAVSNGKQTRDINLSLARHHASVDVLSHGLRTWGYEPDQPNYTPRISGCLTQNAALSIIKRAAGGSIQRQYFELPSVAGSGFLIATYTGENHDPLPSWLGEPIEVQLPFESAHQAAEEFYRALGPRGGSDYRVASAAVFRDAQGAISVSVQNRHKE